MPRFTSLDLARLLVPLGLTLGLTPALPACSADDGEGPRPAQHDVAEAASAARWADVRDFERVVPWGAGDGAVGWRAPAEEFRGDGPSGVAIAPDGRVLVIDRLHRRVVAVDADGATTALDGVAEDAEHLAAAPGVQIATFSSYRSRAWIHAADGSPAVELAVPRGLGEVARIGLGPSLRLELTTAFQERFVLGGRRAQLTAADVLRTKREGALAASDDGPPLVALRGADGACTVRAVSTGPDGRASTGRVVADLGRADAVRLVGRTDEHVVAILEHVAQPGEAIRVSRHLVVVDDASAAVVATRELPTGLWAPRESVTMGGSPPAVAFLVPEPSGLRIGRIDVAALAADAGAEGGAR